MEWSVLLSADGAAIVAAHPSTAETIWLTVRTAELCSAEAV